MREITVWSPEARSVDVVFNSRPLAMTRQNSGWWTAPVPETGISSEYAFLVDGQGPFPDPRSPCQPRGVNGPSRLVDHSAFPWTDHSWQQGPFGSAVVYELHVGTFTPEGTFDAVISRLDHLVDLGITHVEIMPVAEFSGTRGWGYDGVNLYAPHHAYGGPTGLKRLVNACHAKGLGVLLDVVYNHLGPCGNHLGRFGPYFTDRYTTPWGDAVNLDGPDSNEVRRFFIDNALMWLRDFHMDGLRLDAVHAIMDCSAVHFLEQLAREVQDLESHLGRHLVLIAESDLNDPRLIRPPEIGGYGLTAQWNEDFHHAAHAALTGERSGYYRDFGSLQDLADVLARGFTYDGRYSAYRRRSHGRPATGISGHRLVGCIQNHDQVGNRATGERIGHLVSLDRLKLAAALLLTSPFTPMLFQGEEWSASSPFLYFCDHEDPELNEAVRRGRQKEFASFDWDPETIPDPRTEETFRRSGLNWEERLHTPHSDMLTWYRTLLTIRSRTPALRDGRLDRISVHLHTESDILTLSRGPLWVILNFSSSPQTVSVPHASQKSIMACSKKCIISEEHTLLLSAHCAVILGEKNS